MKEYKGDQDSINRYFGEEIRKYRESRNLSQEQFAERCNISRAYYGRIERGEYNVTLRLCHSIANALGVRIYDLFANLPE